MSLDPLFRLFRTTSREDSIRLFPKFFIRETEGGRPWIHFRKGENYYPIYYPVSRNDPENQSLPFRDFFQIVIVVSGAGRHQGVREIKLRQGEIFLVSPREAFQFKPSQKGLHLIVLAFRPSLLGYNDAALVESNLLNLYTLLSPFSTERNFSNPLRPPASVFKKIAFYAFHSIEDFHFGKRGERAIRNLHNILGMLLETLPNSALPKTRAPHVAEVVRYLGEHYREKIPLSFLSRKLKLSPTHLSTVFNKITGASILTFINRLRIEEAKKQLRSSQLPVHRIAIDLGYENVSHFNAVFKNLVSQAPGEYRKMGDAGKRPGLKPLLRTA